MEDKLERPTTSEELTTGSSSQRAEMQIQMPTVSTEPLGKILWCRSARINKGVNLLMCSPDLHGKNLRLLHLGRHVKILNQTRESWAMPVHLVQMPHSWVSSDSPHLPDMLILTQSILQLLSLMLLRQASENAISVPLWVKEADTGLLDFVFILTF